MRVASNGPRDTALGCAGIAKSDQSPHTAARHPVIELVTNRSRSRHVELRHPIAGHTEVGARFCRIGKDTGSALAYGVLGWKVRRPGH